MNGEYVRADRWSEALAITAIPPHCEGALKVSCQKSKDSRPPCLKLTF